MAICDILRTKNCTCCHMYGITERKNTKIVINQTCLNEQDKGDYIDKDTTNREMRQCPLERWQCMGRNECYFLF